jgi:hypothetical protein
MGSTVPWPLTSLSNAVYDAPVIPDPGPRWYETPLWIVAQAAAYVIIVTALRAVLPDDLGSSGERSSQARSSWSRSGERS